MQSLRSRIQPLAVAALGASVVGAAACQLWPSRTYAQAVPVPALDPAEWRKLKLVERKELTSTANPSVLFRLALPDKDQTVALPVASCVLLRSPITKKDGTPGFALRPYTPVSLADERGYLDLVVKVYKTTPKPGVLGNYLDNLKIGDEVDVKGPIPKIPYDDIVKRKEVGLIGGGSGITPLLQVAEEVLRTKAPVKLSLIFANTGEDEIILKDHLDLLAAKHDNFSVHYVVDKTNNKAWDGSVGYVTKDLLESKMPAPSSESLVLVCGPPPMMRSLSGEKLPDKSQGPLSGLLKDIGYSEDNVYKF